MANDSFGRSVTLVSSSGMDHYTVTGADAMFILSFPTGTPLFQVYESINALAPADYIIPPIE